MSGIYVSFNLFVSTISTLYFMTNFEFSTLMATERAFPDLTAITSIYDSASKESDIFRNLIPSLGYLMILLTSFISLSITVYTFSCLFRQRSRILICIFIMCTSIFCLLYPSFYISQILDFKWTGIFIICALILENIGLTWVYGIKSLSIDLEFSIGRPIKQFWFFLWVSTPVINAVIFVFFIVISASSYTLIDIFERWLPFIICLCIFIYFSVYETLKQIDYNTFTKIREATMPTKDFGPVDPIVRHAWKNWKTVCLIFYFFFMVYIIFLSLIGMQWHKLS